MRARIAVLLTLIASVAQAQVLPPRAGGAAARGDQVAANRQDLERRVRQAIARVTRRQLNLNDAQMTQLGQVDMKFERQRRQLFQEQRQNRLALRAAMQDSAANQTLIAQHMDRLLQIERRRVDLLEAEQKDLAAFLTPLQRAKYQALQEQVRRRVEQAMRPAAVGDDSIGPPAGLRGQRRRPLIRPPL